MNPKTILFVLSMHVLCSVVMARSLPQPTAPKRPERWVYNEALSDEFEGQALNASKWYDHNPT